MSDHDTMMRITPVLVLVVCAGLILVAVSVRYMLLGAYEVTGSSECDPEYGACFEYCEDEGDCYTYQIVRMKALDTPACSSTDEACVLDGCVGAGESCYVIPCTEKSLMEYGYEGVRCSVSG